MFICFNLYKNKCLKTSKMNDKYNKCCGAAVITYWVNINIM